MDPWLFSLALVLLVWVSWLILLVTRALERVALQKYAIRARVAANARAGKSKKTSDDDEPIPPFLLGIAQGAGIDTDRLLQGDPAEAAKAQALIAKFSKPGPSASDVI